MKVTIGNMHMYEYISATGRNYAVVVVVSILRTTEIVDDNHVLQLAQRNLGIITCCCCIPILITTFPANLNGTYPWPRYGTGITKFCP